MRLLFISLITLALVLTGCGVSSVVTSLELVTAASEAAVGALEGAGQITPATAMLIDQYLAQVSMATQFAATELASTDTTPEKISKIASQFAGIAIPDLPPGTAQAIVLTVQAVAKAVAAFLMNIQTPTPPASKFVLSDNDRAKLAQIRGRAGVVYARTRRK
jgi:hypothetical protein